MRKICFTETQIIGMIKEQEAGLTVARGLPQARHPLADRRIPCNRRQAAVPVHGWHGGRGR